MFQLAQDEMPLSVLALRKSSKRDPERLTWNIVTREDRALMCGVVGMQLIVGRERKAGISQQHEEGRVMPSWGEAEKETV